MNYKEYEFFSDNFEDQLEEQIQKIESEYAELPVSLTGNAFVDAGIYAVSIIQDKSLNSITIGDVLDTILNIDGQNSRGKAFAYRNSRIKSTSKVLFNNPLNQPAYGSTSKSKTGYYKAPSKAQPSPLQERLYRAYLVEFLISYGYDLSKDDASSQCMICGQFTDFDFNDLETSLKELVKNGDLDKKDDFGSGPTRTWFPLMGSTSSIQSLPGFAEFNIICGKCLALSQFLPQVCDLQNGLLTLYQSSDHRLAMEFYRANLKTFKEMHDTTPSDEKLEIIGKDNWDYYINNLIRIITENEEELAHANLTLWRFDNYGTDPDLDYIQLPNRTLRFLFTLIVEFNAEKFLKRFIRFEEENKVPYSLRLFNCIQSNSDYFLFYPYTKYDIEEQIPQNIYELYQFYIRGWSLSSLNTVRTISQFIKDNADYDEDQLLRVLKSRNTGEIRRYVTPFMVQSLAENNISTEDVLELMEMPYVSSNNLNPWKLFQYYLHPTLTISQEKYDDQNDELTIEPGRVESLTLIQHVAILTNSQKQKLSSYDEDKYLNTIRNYRFNNFVQDYTIAGLNHPSLTWEKLEIIQHHLYKNEIAFYFRIFSIQPSEQLIMKEQLPNKAALLDQSGLNPTLADVIESYIDARIKEVGVRRTFDELDIDLKYDNYSARQFFNILLGKMDKYEIATDFNEYHFFTYELEYSSKYQPRGGWGKKPSFSWSRLRNKIRLFIAQYHQVREPTLEQQIKEEQQ